MRSATAVKVFGPVLAELRNLGAQVPDAMQDILGVVDRNNLETISNLLLPALYFQFDKFFISAKNPQDLVIVQKGIDENKINAIANHKTPIN